MRPGTPDGEVRGEQGHRGGHRGRRSHLLGGNPLSLEGGEETADAHDTRVAVTESLRRGEERDHGVEVVAAGNVPGERGAPQPLRPRESLAVGKRAIPCLPQDLARGGVAVGARRDTREHASQLDDARACRACRLGDIGCGVALHDGPDQQVADEIGARWRRLARVGRPMRFAQRACEHT